MNNLEKQLHRIDVQKASESEKNSMWLSIITKRETYKEKGLALSIFNLKKYMIGAVIGLMIILGGGGVVAASDNARPGDALYSLDLAVEKAKLNMVGNAEKKDELRIKFANERVAEAKSKSETSGVGSANTRDVDLSSASVSEIEVDVFTNETTVKIEANDKHYGFVTTKKAKAEIVAEIKAKYNLSEEKINAVMDFETEDRASRADDKGFLNSSNSGSIKIRSEKEARDFEMSLRSLSKDADLSDEAQVKLNLAIAEIIAILEADTNNEIKMENGDFKFEMKGNSGTKFDSHDDSDKSKSKSDDDDSRDDDSQSRKSNTGINVNVGGGLNLGGDVREDENEVFCRGEWRDAEDCDDDNDNSGSDDNHSDDDSDDNSRNGDDDDDNSGSGSNH